MTPLMKYPTTCWVSFASLGLGNKRWRSWYLHVPSLAPRSSHDAGRSTQDERRALPFILGIKPEMSLAAQVPTHHTYLGSNKLIPLLGRVDRVDGILGELTEPTGDVGLLVRSERNLHIVAQLWTQYLHATSCMKAAGGKDGPSCINKERCEAGMPSRDRLTCPPTLHVVLALRVPRVY